MTWKEYFVGSMCKGGNVNGKEDLNEKKKFFEAGGSRRCRHGDDGFSLQKYAGRLGFRGSPPGADAVPHYQEGAAIKRWIPFVKVVEPISLKEKIFSHLRSYMSNG